MYSTCIPFKQEKFIIILQLKQKTIITDANIKNKSNWHDNFYIDQRSIDQNTYYRWYYMYIIRQRLHLNFHQGPEISILLPQIGIYLVLVYKKEILQRVKLNIESADSDVGFTASMVSANIFFLLMKSLTDK